MKMLPFDSKFKYLLKIVATHVFEEREGLSIALEEGFDLFIQQILESFL